MNIIIQSSIKTLEKAKYLLNRIDNVQLSNHSVSPYYSCIGSHLRHILDFYDCILHGIYSDSINLINRNRDERIHCDRDYAILNVNRTIKKLEAIGEGYFKSQYLVTDNLGLGEVCIEYSLNAILAQANSHAIHHYAIIGYIMDRLGIEIEDESFGYNPTTPKTESNLS